MGQRLVIDLIQNDEIVAAVYYHWSAYFGSTVGELAKLSRAILDKEKYGANRLLAVLKVLQEPTRNLRDGISRGGVSGGYENEKEMAMVKKLFPNYKLETDFVDRNEGLIAFTKEGIDDFHRWEEGHAEINLDTLEISNSVDLDSFPFEFVDAVYEKDDDEEYFSYAESGIIRINGHTSTIDAFDCTCEEIIKLEEWMEKEYEEWKSGMADKLL